jgi:cytochrome P450
MCRVSTSLLVQIDGVLRLNHRQYVVEVPTFLLAGHETTRWGLYPCSQYIAKFFCCSTAVAWTFFALSCHPTVQAALRAELRTCPTDFPTMEQLNSLSYLEGVLRESLRLYSPTSFTQRVAHHDMVIPLQKPFTDEHGVLQNTIRYERYS